MKKILVVLILVFATSVVAQEGSNYWTWVYDSSFMTDNAQITVAEIGFDGENHNIKIVREYDVPDYEIINSLSQSVSGRYLALSVQKDDNGPDILLLDLQTGTLKQITKDSKFQKNPLITANKIFYIERSPGFTGDFLPSVIFEYDINTGKLRQLDLGSTTYDIEALAFEVRSQTLYFSATTIAQNGEKSNAIYKHKLGKTEVFQNIDCTAYQLEVENELIAWRVGYIVQVYDLAGKRVYSRPAKAFNLDNQILWTVSESNTVGNLVMSATDPQTGLSIDRQTDIPNNIVRNFEVSDELFVLTASNFQTQVNILGKFGFAGYRSTHVISVNQSLRNFLILPSL